VAPKGLSLEFPHERPGFFERPRNSQFFSRSSITCTPARESRFGAANYFRHSGYPQ
jgi:hypothetical protein